MIYSSRWTKHIVTLLFFIGTGILGLTIYKDYGISWDESIQRQYGIDNYNYILKKDQRLLKSKDKYYGPAIEIFLVSAEKFLNLQDAREIYLTRHFLNFGIFYMGVIFFYLLCKKLLGNWKWGILGAVLLTISPRIFGHSFFNSKDIPVMVFFIISVYTMINFLTNRNIGWTLFHALATAILIDIRIVGVLVIVLTVLFCRKNWESLVVYLATSALFIVLFWPTLWKSPLKEFINAFEQMQNYPQQTSTLTLGKSLKSTKLPWYYAPVWISVTTPITYLAFAAAGAVTTFSKGKKFPDLAIFGWLFLPLIAVITFKSTLYNGWRQLFFIYPALLIFSLKGLQTLIKTRFRKAVITLLTLDMVLTLITMVKLHPYQNVYFNFLAGPKEKLEQRFSLDYWGLSYKDALEYIAINDNKANIKVGVGNLPGVTNHLALKPTVRSKLTVEERIVGPDYLVTPNILTSYKEPFHTVKVSNIPLLRIYQITKSIETPAITE